jgi:hypothetical protein
MDKSDCKTLKTDKRSPDREAVRLPIGCAGELDEKG